MPFRPGYLYVRPQMDARSAPRNGPNYIWATIVALYMVFVAVGTLSPWPVAAARLGELGAGPFVPVTYSYLSGDTRTYRSQIYIVPSLLRRSLSTYRVSQENDRVRVEEVRFGALYIAVFTAVALISAVWSVLRATAPHRGAEPEA
jgi:hypothetical protein